MNDAYDNAVTDKEMLARLTKQRYIVEPTRLIDGWWSVRDSETGELAKIRSRVLFRELDKAEMTAKRLNKQLTARGVCKACRHRVLKVEIFNGQCKECRNG